MTTVPSHSHMDIYDYHLDPDDYQYGAMATASPEYLDRLYRAQVFGVTLQVINVIITLLGLCGNGLVIWIASFKMKRTVNTTWYLSLAFSDFIYCAALPFSIHQMATNEWLFGLFMCKFTSFVMFLNMFSSIFLMVIISVDRCVAVIFPVWAQNHRTLKRAAAAVVIAWLISMALSVPSLVFRETRVDEDRTRCYNNFESALPGIRTSIPVGRFVLGFVLPLIIITTCYTVIILRLRANKMIKSTKPFKVMTALIVTFLISWLPYHIFILLEIGSLHSLIQIVERGMKISVTLAGANSCMNPFLYAFMGNDFKQKFCSSIISKIENAFMEEGHDTTSKGTVELQVSSKQSTTD